MKPLAEKLGVVIAPQIYLHIYASMWTLVKQAEICYNLTMCHWSWNRNGQLSQCRSMSWCYMGTAYVFCRMVWKRQCCKWSYTVGMRLHSARHENMLDELKYAYFANTLLATWYWYATQSIGVTFISIHVQSNCVKLGHISHCSFTSLLPGSIYIMYNRPITHFVYINWLSFIDWCLVCNKLNSVSLNMLILTRMKVSFLNPLAA